MLSSVISADIATIFQHFASICQLTTTLIAAGIGIITFRYTRRQSQLALINQNNAQANLVNRAIIDSEAARLALGKVDDFIVGCPDDAVIFMYLNYVHNTYRMRQIRAVSVQVWQDTLGSCVTMLGRLRRDQVVRLLSRGYERGFQDSVLLRYDAIAGRAPAAVAVLHRPSPSSGSIVFAPDMRHGLVACH